jgi:hypothetical protein
MLTRRRTLEAEIRYKFEEPAVTKGMRTNEYMRKKDKPISGLEKSNAQRQEAIGNGIERCSYNKGSDKARGRFDYSGQALSVRVCVCVFLPQMFRGQLKQKSVQSKCTSEVNSTETICASYQSPLLRNKPVRWPRSTLYKQIRNRKVQKPSCAEKYQAFWTSLLEFPFPNL